MADTKNAENKNNKINRYIYIFTAFIAVMLIVFLALRYNTTSSEAAVDNGASAPKQEEVIVKKDPNLAEKKQKLLKDTSGDYYLGKKFAPVVVIEYASLSCPHCAHFHENVVGPLIPNYIDTGKVKYVYRDFPLNISAVAASKTAHCADPDKFFSFIKVLFKSQEQWAYSDNYLATLKSIAKIGGVDEKKFDQCQKDKALEDKIFKVQQDAVDILEVQSTPTVFINGNKYEGPAEYKDVAAYIDKQLKGE